MTASKRRSILIILVGIFIRCFPSGVVAETLAQTRPLVCSLVKLRLEPLYVFYGGQHDSDRAC
jgi:hypothetical protein